MKPVLSFIAAFALTIMTLQQLAMAQSPVMKWDFEEVINRNVIDQTKNISDTLEGNFELAPGVKGNGLRLDGFTTRIVRNAKDIVKPGSELSVEAWVSLGEYPVNWCPVITTETNEIKGYRLMIGPYGQVSFEIAIGEQWISCTSSNETIHLREWMYIVGVYKANEELALYVNGHLISSIELNGALNFANNSKGILGMVAAPRRPSNTIRTWGTVPAYYGLDGIIDEISVYDKALTADQVYVIFSETTVNKPDIQPRRLPVIENDPGRFGAFYTRLNYYPGWDNLWPVDQDPDIVVCFDNNPARLIFWRGIRYGPSWVSENQNWMTDQSLETWGIGDKDTEGCFEHMQDRHCRFSHVRIIENNEARAVVHWRYAPVSSHNNLWLPDPKTGWECWVDEYYYIYPDGTAIRKVSWNKGTTGRALQLQESLPLTQPGQTSDEVIEDNYVTVADYDNHSTVVSMKMGRHPADWTGKYTIQQYNFKSEAKPFICFEPGNEMWIRWIGGGYNHFPVNQARSDGLWAKTTDRPTHFASSPCSDPVIHENGNRLYWIGLYGMNDYSMNELVSFGRSWAYAPELSVESSGCTSHGYDRSQRCYQLENIDGEARPISFTLRGSKDSPVINPAFLIKKWNSSGARVLVNGEEDIHSKVGVNRKLHGDDLLVYITLREEKAVTISIMP